MAKQKENVFKYRPSKSETKAMSKCLRHRITIYPVPKNGHYQLVIMKANGYKQTGKQLFPTYTDAWYRKIYEIYLILEKQL